MVIYGYILSIILTLIVFDWADASCSLGSITFTKVYRRIREIPRDQIAANTTAIILNNNRINTTSASDFLALKCLQIIKLDSNKLTYFPNFTFVGRSLREVYISDNEITFIDIEILQELHVIEYLDLRDNKFTSLPNVTAVGKTLRKLVIGGATVSEFTADLLNGMSKLETFSWTSTLHPLFPYLYHIRSTLLELDLSNNGITHIPANFLNILAYLKILKLTDNLLTTIPDVSGPGKSLIRLSLNRNKIHAFPKLKHIGQNLQYLDLDRNYIESISIDYLLFPNRTNSSNVILSIEFNKIISIPPIVGSGVARVKIEAYKNPLECDMRMSWMVFTSSVTAEGSCRTPPRLYGIHVSDLTLQNLGNGRENRTGKPRGI